MSCLKFILLIGLLAASSIEAHPHCVFVLGALDASDSTVRASQVALEALIIREIENKILGILNTDQKNSLTFYIRSTSGKHRQILEQNGNFNFLKNFDPREQQLIASAINKLRSNRNRSELMVAHDPYSSGYLIAALSLLDESLVEGRTNNTGNILVRERLQDLYRNISELSPSYRKHLVAVNKLRTSSEVACLRISSSTSILVRKRNNSWLIEEVSEDMSQILLRLEYIRLNFAASLSPLLDQVEQYTRSGRLDLLSLQLWLDHFSLRLSDKNNSHEADSIKGEWIEVVRQLKQDEHGKIFFPRERPEFRDQRLSKTPDFEVRDSKTSEVTRSIEVKTLREFWKYPQQLHHFLVSAREKGKNKVYNLNTVTELVIQVPWSADGIVLWKEKLPRSSTVHTAVVDTQSGERLDEYSPANGRASPLVNGNLFSETEAYLKQHLSRAEWDVVSITDRSGHLIFKIKIEDSRED
jgi:hypothetical protein